MKTQKNILIAFLLNLSFSIFELIGGAFTNSIAIISDSVHDMADALSIGISYYLERKSKKKPDDNYTYGYLRYSVIGSSITTAILLSGSIIVIYHAILRILHPTPVNYNGMLYFAILGVMINFLAAYFTREGNSLNQKSVNLHMLEDVLGWIVVLIGAFIMKFTDISILDPILSIGVAIFILIHAIKNFKEILNVFLEKVPNNIKVETIKKELLKMKEIIDVHHIHIWSMDGFMHYATMHVVADNYTKELKKKIREELEHHGIQHVTIELEEKGETCEEKNCEVEHQNQIPHHHHH